MQKNVKKTNLAPIAVLQKCLLIQENCIICHKRKNKGAFCYLWTIWESSQIFTPSIWQLHSIRLRIWAGLTTHYLHFSNTMSKLELGILQWQTLREISIVTEGKGFSSSPMQRNMSRYLVRRHRVAFLYWERYLMLSPSNGCRRKNVSWLGKENITESQLSEKSNFYPMTSS